MKIGDTPRRSKRYRLPACPEHVLVEWYRFTFFRLARQEFKRTPCLYAFVDPDSHLPDYVGKTTTGLGQRYQREPRASKGALVFVAPIDSPYLEFVEHMLIFWHGPPFNQQGYGTLPLPHVRLLHRFKGVDSWWGDGTARSRGEAYEGPLFYRPGFMRDLATGRVLM